MSVVTHLLQVLGLHLVLLQCVEQAVLGSVHAVLDELVGPSECLLGVGDEAIVEGAMVIQVHPAVGEGKQDVTDQISREQLDEKRVESDT